MSIASLAWARTHSPWRCKAKARFRAAEKSEAGGNFLSAIATTGRCDLIMASASEAGGAMPAKMVSGNEVMGMFINRQNTRIPATLVMGRLGNVGKAGATGSGILA